MLTYLPVMLFAVTAVIASAVLADAFVRLGNAWQIARRERAHIEADLTIEARQIGVTRQFGQAEAMRRPARHRPIAAVSRPAARRAPLACAA